MAIPGGSAFGYARDIAEGYQVVTERSFKGLTRPELDQLAFEIDRGLRDIRAEQVPVDELVAVPVVGEGVHHLQRPLGVRLRHGHTVRSALDSGQANIRRG